MYDKNTDSSIGKHAKSKSTMLKEVEHNLKITNYHKNEGKGIDSHIMKCI